MALRDPVAVFDADTNVEAETRSRQQACNLRREARQVHMPKVRITLLCIAAAVAYGIVHDQITARLCVEYFTVAHPPLIHTRSPTVLGFFWGTAATIGVGVILGVVLTLVSQSEGVPPLPVPRVFRMVVGLLAITAIAAALAGVVGFELSRRSIVRIPATLVHLVSSDHRDRFMAVWFVHAAS